MVELKISLESFASLLVGLYASSHDMTLMTVPVGGWMILAEELNKHLPTWMYEVQSLESWVNESLIITVKEILTPEDLEIMQKYPIYFEIANGNATLVFAGDIVWYEI